MDAWLPFGRMPRLGSHLAGPGRLAGRLSSLHDGKNKAQLPLYYKVAVVKYIFNILILIMYPI